MKNEFVVGRIPVLECLRAGKRPARGLFLLKKGKGLDEIERAAPGIPVERCSRNELDRLSGDVVHQGVVLEAGALPVHNADTWIDRSFSSDALVMVLDGVEDPHNFGAIVRSAAACGVCAVVFGKDRAAPISPVSVKSAAGGMEYVDLVRATNLVRVLDGLKERGFWVGALAADAGQAVWDADLTGRIALVVGSEGKGVRRLMREHSDFELAIPLSGPIAHLNASVSAAIALYECRRQREARAHPPSTDRK
ncbi:MAG: 23S rRNA (guanosine(2251)-2'-O)-methyltransferase RlmB [Candidatus Hydrogenedentes bacterium]|nr:23S rRNA (guanosine(2251)-2'-O)-methyltransferase RlmB [Candidatus Hydrogenedentota bacterium]